MQGGKWIWRGLILGLLIIIMASGTSAQPMITSTPPSLTISQTNPFWFFFIPAGGSWTTERTLILDATDNLTDLSSWPPDMTQEDGGYSLDPGSVNITITEDALAALKTEGVAGIPVLFQFGRTTQSGKYTGNLLFTFRDATESRGSLSVPVTLNVKDNPVFPFLILLLSTAVGVLYFIYREKGRPYDVFKLELDRFRESMGNDTEFQGLPESIYFRKKIYAEIEEISSDLGKPDLTAAQGHLDAAKVVWGEWLVKKGVLPSLLKRQKQFREGIPRLKGDLGKILEGNSLFLDQLEDFLDKILNDLLKPEDSEKFSKAFEKFWNDLDDAGNNCHSFRDLVDRAKRTEDSCRAQTPPNPECLNKVRICKMKLREIAYGKISVPDCALTGYAPPPSREPRETVTAGDFDRQKWLGEALSWELLRYREKFLSPATRLRYFSYATFLILVVILVATGYKELYEASSTFGTVTDYIAIILWGFGVGTGSEYASTALTNFAAVKIDWPY
jgi:hypothetical protein